MPRAIAFSGGIDSTTIALLSAGGSDGAPPLYCVDELDYETGVSDVPWAKHVAAEINCPLNLVDFDTSDILQVVDAVYPYFDQPCRQMALTYAFRLFSAVGADAIVALTRNGADEVFAGYDGDASLVVEADAPTFWKLLRRFDPSIAMDRPEFRAALAPGAPPALRLVTLQLLRSVISLSRTETLARRSIELLTHVIRSLQESGAEHPLDVKMQLSLSLTNSEANFRIPDTVGYLAGVEVRSPFLDHRIVDFSCRVAPEMKVTLNSGQPCTKAIPKEFLEQYVAPDIVWRPKLGMAAGVNFARDLALDRDFAPQFRSSMRSLRHAGVRTTRREWMWKAYRFSQRHPLRGNFDVYLDPGAPSQAYLVGDWLGRKSLRALM